jgi:hypothetical protein
MLFGMTQLTEESNYIPIMFWSKLTQNLDFAMSMMSLFLPSNTSKFITYTPFSLEMIVQELIGCPY